MTEPLAKLRTPDEASRLLQEWAAAGRIDVLWGLHAPSRGSLRGASFQDFLRCLTTGRVIEVMPGKFAGSEKWKVRGRDLDGDFLEVVVAYDGEPGTLAAVTVLS